MSLFEYVKKKNKEGGVKTLLENESYKIGGIDVYLRDELPDNIDITNVISKLKDKLPSFILRKIDDIYIGDFGEFEQRDIDAFYKEHSFYISNEQDSEQDMLENILHEVAHLIEDIYTQDIYDSSKIEDEFRSKRLMLFRMLKHDGYSVKKEDFMNLKYDESFDKFLLREVGYNKLAEYTSGLFVSPYAPTSLREYFATGFTEFLKGNKKELKELSPKLYEKISDVFS